MQDFLGIKNRAAPNIRGTKKLPAHRVSYYVHFKAKMAPNGAFSKYFGNTYRAEHYGLVSMVDYRASVGLDILVPQGKFLAKTDAQITLSWVSATGIKSFDRGGDCQKFDTGCPKSSYPMYSHCFDHNFYK